MHPIRPDLLSQGRALAFGFGQAIVFHAMAIALKPLRADLAGEPIGSEERHIIQHSAQGFAHTFQIGKRAHAGEHMGGIGALFASGLSHPRCLHRSSNTSSSNVSACPATRRSRNSASTEASKPGSESSKPSAYFQSIRPRTASAA